MDFSPTDDVLELSGLVRDMCTRLVTPGSLSALDERFGPGTEAGGGDRETARLHERLWEELVRAGAPAALGPEAVGGAGLGVVGEVLVLRELGRAVAPVPLSSAVRATHLLAASGEAERARDVADGRVIAGVAAPARAGAGPDTDGGGLTDLGEVDWAPVADLVLAPIAGDAESEALYVLDVAAGRASGAYESERTIPVDYSCAGTVAAPLSAGPPHVHDWAAFAQLPSGSGETDRLRRRVHLAAYQWGVLEAALEHTVAYASEREQFGRPIGTFQAVSARLADGHIDVDAVRLTTLRAAYELDAAGVAGAADGAAGGAPGASGAAPGAAARDAVASAHFWACEVGHRVAHTAVHVHGGVGLDRDHLLHRYFLAAKAQEFRLGGPTAQLIDLGDRLVEAGDPWA